MKTHEFIKKGDILYRWEGDGATPRQVTELLPDRLRWGQKWIKFHTEDFARLGETPEEAVVEAIKLAEDDATILKHQLKVQKEYIAELEEMLQRKTIKINPRKS